MCLAVLGATVALAADENAAPEQPDALQSPGLRDLRVGPFDLHPRLTIGAVHDDNILISSQNPKSDLIASVHPAIQLAAGDRLFITDYKLNDRDVMSISSANLVTLNAENWPGKLVVIDYGPKFNWYTRYGENDSIDQLARANIVWPMAKLVLGINQAYRLEKVAIIEAGQRSTRELISSEFMAGYQFSENTSAESNFQRVSQDYESTSLAGYTEWINDNWGNYQITPLVNLGLGITLGDVEAADQNQKYEQILVRTRYRLAERVSATVSCGGEFRQLSGGCNTIEPVFILQGIYQPFDRTAITVNGYRHDQASVYSGYNYIVTGISTGLRQKLGDRYYLSLAASYDNYAYLTRAQSAAQDWTDNYYTLHGGVGTKLTRHLDASLFYRFRTLDSNQRAGFDNNQIGLEMTLSY